MMQAYRISATLAPYGVNIRDRAGIEEIVPGGGKVTAVAAPGSLVYGDFAQVTYIINPTLNRQELWIPVGTFDSSSNAVGWLLGAYAQSGDTQWSTYLEAVPAAQQPTPQPAPQPLPQSVPQPQPQPLPQPVPQPQPTPTPGADPFAAAKLIALQKTNELRARVGVAAVTYAPDKDACTYRQAVQDAQSGQVHGSFMAGDLCGETAMAQNVSQTWPSPTTPPYAAERMTAAALDRFFAEGPTGSHYKNLVNPMWTRMSVAYTLAPDGQKTWFVQNFFAQPQGQGQYVPPPQPQPVPQPQPTPAPPPATTGDRYAAARQLALQKTNELRARVGAPPLAYAPDKDACTDKQAAQDARANQPHYSFLHGDHCDASSQNTGQAPGYTAEQITPLMLDAMFREGPGGGGNHYDHIVSTRVSRMSAGYALAPDGRTLWFVQNFYR